MSKYNVTCDKSLSELNSLLSTNLFIGGQHPNAQDAFTFEAFEGTAPEVGKYPAVTAWFYLVHNFEHIRDHWKSIKEEEKKGGKAKEVKEEKPKKETKKADDDDDMFGDTQESEEDKQKLEAKKQKAKEEADKKKAATEKKKEDEKKKAPIGKSLVILNVKVNELDTDFKDLFEKVTSLNIEGLIWKQDYKNPEVAFGMKMLVVGCSIIDDLVSIDEDVIAALYEKYGNKEDEDGEVIEEGIIQSIDIASFDKI